MISSISESLETRWESGLTNQARRKTLSHPVPPCERPPTGTPSCLPYILRPNFMTLAAQSSITDRWVATDGVSTVGPVTLDVLRRQFAQGRIAADALVRHESWQVWRSLADFVELPPEERTRTVKSCAEMSAGADERASGPHSVAPPPPPSSELQAPTSDSTKPPSSNRRPVDPVGILAQSRDLSDALLLTVSTVVAAAGAQVGLYHRLRRDLDALVVMGAHGPNAENLLGERMTSDDPTLALARAGTTVLVEPQPGEVGRHVLGRLSRCISVPCGAAMVPLVLRGELLAVFEVARQAHPFSARDVARIEDVVQALGERIAVMGWDG